MHQFRDNWNCLPPLAPSSCLVQLGRFGDIINVLPIAAEMLRKTGVKPGFCVAKEFASVLEGVTYCVPEIWDGPFNEAAGAVMAMAGRYTSVRVSQVLAKDTTWKPVTTSYALDSWLRAGFLPQWKDLPLVFDNRSPEREAALVEKLGVTDRTLVIALEGKNSPVEQADDIAWWLSETLEGWKIVNLNGVRVHRIYDLLGVLDKAGMLLAADSAILHLAAASPVKTIAFLADLLSAWRASAPKCNLVGSLLYSQVKDLDFAMGKVGAWLSAVVPSPESVRGSGLRGLRRESDGTDGKDGTDGVPSFTKQTPWKSGLFEIPAQIGASWFNPSIVEWDGKLLTAVRQCTPLPKYASRRTEGAKHAGPNTILLFETVNSKDGGYAIGAPYGADICPNSPEECYEDPRLCVLGGELAVSFCNFRHGAIQKVGFVNRGGCYFPSYGGNGRTHEKNWTWFERGVKTMFVYKPWPHEVVEVNERGMPVDFWMGDEGECPWKFGPMHGGSPPVLVEGQWWSFFHSAIDGKNPRRRYYMGAYCFQNEPPFAIQALTMDPLLTGSEEDGGDLPVVFPGGAVLRDGVWLVALGINDAKCGFIEIPHKELLERMTIL